MQHRTLASLLTKIPFSNTNVWFSIENTKFNTEYEAFSSDHYQGFEIHWLYFKLTVDWKIEIAFEKKNKGRKKGGFLSRI